MFQYSYLPQESPKNERAVVVVQEKIRTRAQTKARTGTRTW
jgi:hypothetical protein